MEQLLLTAFTHALGGPATSALGGVVGGLGGGAPIGRLVLLHLLYHWIFWQVHLEVAEIKAGRNDIHVRHVPSSPPPVTQDLLQ